MFVCRHGFIVFVSLSFFLIFGQGCRERISQNTASETKFLGYKKTRGIYSFTLRSNTPKPRGGQPTPITQVLDLDSVCYYSVRTIVRNERHLRRYEESGGDFSMSDAEFHRINRYAINPTNMMESGKLKSRWIRGKRFFKAIGMGVFGGSLILGAIPLGFFAIPIAAGSAVAGGAALGAVGVAASPFTAVGGSVFGTLGGFSVASEISSRGSKLSRAVKRGFTSLILMPTGFVSGALFGFVAPPIALGAAGALSGGLVGAGIVAGIEAVLVSGGIDSMKKFARDLKGSMSHSQYLTVNDFISLVEDSENRNLAYIYGDVDGEGRVRSLTTMDLDLIEESLERESKRVGGGKIFKRGRRKNARKCPEGKFMSKGKRFGADPRFSR